MNKTALIMILGILGCGKAFAATELQLQQKRVMHFCANASLPLLIAGTTYANTSDNGRPEKERVAILKNSVASSTAYKMASPGVQMAMMSVVEDIADPKELALHQKEVRRLGASYLSGHCCKVSDEAAFCLIQRPYISKTLLTRRISPRGSP
ncbi:hypothetical protein [Escherichia coli]|uniref:hypothetical protein n=2 Tax=Escherichia coli TaxID=562 RepID=UPI0025737E8B|nr:hypothetical protein [Escherichia coli]BDY62009.1 hypothetical protein MUTS7_02500 [Escherichia coli]